MGLSGEEQRRWRELEDQLAQEPRLVALAGRLAEGDPTAVMTRMASLVWAVGSALGLVVAIVGWADDNSGVGMAGVGILVVTVVLAGMAMMMIGISGLRRPASG